VTKEGKHQLLANSEFHYTLNPKTQEIYFRLSLGFKRFSCKQDSSFSAEVSSLSFPPSLIGCEKDLRNPKPAFEGSKLQVVISD